MRSALLVSFATAVLMTAGPAPAQKNSVIVVYGDDECPQAKEGEDIIVCARRPESERYRVPKRFRNQDISPQNGNESWAVRSEALNEVAPGGISKCSNIGPAGWTGCFAQFMREAQAQRRAADRAAAAVPSAQDRPLPGTADEEE